MYHNENVTLLVRYNKHKHHTDISTQQSYHLHHATMIMPQLWYVSRVRTHTVLRDVSDVLVSSKSMENGSFDL